MERLSTRKRVPVSQIKPGMYVISLDRSWFLTPFLFHRRLIKDAEQIELLKKRGVREVVIDTVRGVDVEAPLPDAAPVTLAEVPSENETTSKKHPEARSIVLSEAVFRPLVEELQVARTIHDETLAAAQRIFDGVGSGSPLNSPIAQKVVTGLLRSITRSPEANLLLAQMRRFHNDLFTHAVNVCVLCLVIGTLDEGFDSEISALGLGALLHDVGQTRLPRNLVHKRAHTRTRSAALWNNTPDWAPLS